MSWRNEIGSYFLITAVAALIWFWAAGETREVTSVSSRAFFSVPGDEQWSIGPDNHAFNMEIEGSRLSIQNAKALAQDGFTFDLAANVDPQVIVKIEDELRNHPAFIQTGATLISVDRHEATISVDRIVQVEVTITPKLPGVRTVDAQAALEPATVTLSLPSLLLSRYVEPKVEAFLSQEQSSQLGEGIPYRFDATLRIMPDILNTNENVSLSLNTTRMSFMIRSQTITKKLDRPVNVMVMHHPDDQSGYEVKFEPATLRDVTISANAEIIRQITDGEAVVFASVQIKSSDHERIASAQTTESFPITIFLATAADGVGHPVSAKVGDSDQLPTINVTITRRETPPAE